MRCDGSTSFGSPNAQNGRAKCTQLSVVSQVTTRCGRHGERTMLSMASGGVLRHCGIGYDFLYFESTDPSYKEDTE